MPTALIKLHACLYPYRAFFTQKMEHWKWNKANYIITKSKHAAKLWFCVLYHAYRAFKIPPGMVPYNVLFVIGDRTEEITHKNSESFTERNILYR
jgi:hypothetical protein